MHSPNKKGAIAQSVEQRTENPCVPGSIPGGTTSKTLKFDFKRLFFMPTNIIDVFIRSEGSHLEIPLSQRIFIPAKPIDMRFILTQQRRKLLSVIITKNGFCKSKEKISRK